MLSIAIVGLPNVGKSTLFNVLTKKGVEASNYPFCTIDPNVGVVSVPDERLLKIAGLSKPKKIIPAAIEFVDIAGLVKGAHKGEGLGNQFLSHIRECDAICEVVRDFKNDNIIHVEGSVNPERDRETINLELIFADLKTAEKSLDRLSREAKSGDKELIKQKEILEKIKGSLDQGKAVREINFDEEENKFVKSFSFLTAKPIIYLLNADEGGKDPLLTSPLVRGRDNLSPSPYEGEGRGGVWDGDVIAINAKIEEEIAALSEDEQKEFMAELGIKDRGLDRLIRASYRLLGLQTFFTTGPDETKAWTVRVGAKAPEAAGVIHTDFEKGFIRAEVMSYEKFLEAGSEPAAREKGWIRTEGKDYVMQDGDICHFLFNR
ncbi:MAG: redox-regulated ATPase YchF [Patescibacteria group bacterium]|jgi:hypothetical protein